MEPPFSIIICTSLKSGRLKVYIRGKGEQVQVRGTKVKVLQHASRNRRVSVSRQPQAGFEKLTEAIAFAEQLKKDEVQLKKEILKARTYIGRNIRARQLLYEIPLTQGEY